MNEGNFNINNEITDPELLQLLDNKTAKRISNEITSDLLKPKSNPVTKPVSRGAY